MRSLNSITRFHLRAGGAWAALAGMFFAFRVGGDITLVSEFLASGNAALLAAVMGLLGNAWIAAHLRAFSTMLSEKGIPVGVSNVIAIGWQVATAGVVISQFGPVFPLFKFASPPFLLALLGGGIFVIQARIMLSHRTRPTPLHWVHFVASASLALSSLFIEAVPAGEFSSRFLSPLFAFGWTGAASIALFAAGISLESYEDMRPLWVALGGLGGMLLGRAAGPSGSLVFALATLAFVLSLAFLLAARWDGQFSAWSERLLMAGVVGYFFAATEPEEAILIPALIFLVPEFQSVPLFPVLIPGILIPAFAWGGAAMLAMNGGQVREKLARIMLWVGCFGMAGPWFVTRLLFMRPDERYESFFIRGLFVAGTVGTVWGFLSLAALLRQPRKNRRQRRLKVVD